MGFIKHCRKRAWLMAIAIAAACLSVAAHAEEEWIYLNGPDASGAKTAFNSASHWSSGEEPKPGKYYRTDIYTMYTPTNAEDIVFAGACLKVEKRLWYTTPAKGSATISNMIGVAGADIYTAGGKGPLYGTLTLESTLAKPFSWLEGYQKGSATHNLRMNLVGDGGTRFSFTNGHEEIETITKTFYYDGDLSRFYGMLDVLTANTLVQLSGAATNFPGTLKSANGGQLKVVVAAGTTNRINTVDTTDMTVVLNEDSVLHVDSEFETHGVPVKVIYNPALVATAEEHVLMTFGAGVAESLSESDFAVACTNVASLVASGLSLRPEVLVTKTQIRSLNGVRSLVVSHREIVYQDTSDAQSVTSVFSGDHWDHVPVDSSSADYYIVQTMAYHPVSGGTNPLIEFPGASLTLGGGIGNIRGKLTSSKAWRLNVSDFRWTAIDNDGDRRYISMYGGLTIDGGTITVLPAKNATFAIELWNDRTFIFNSTFRGSGDLLLTVNEAASETPRGIYHFAADNSAFTGRMRVMHKAFTKPGPSASPDDYFVTVKVASQTNLGGALPAFDAESLSLEDNSLLSVTQSAVFDEPTRGWSVKGHGRIAVPQGATVVVTNKTITYVDDGSDAGRFTKEGAGTLVLGGTAVAESGEAKVLEVKEGALRLASTTAAAGLTVSVKSGATLSLDLSASGEFKDKGVVNAAATPFAVEGGGAIPVALMASAELPDEAVEVAICTVSDTLAGTLAFSVPSRFSNRAVSIVTRDNEDGTVTFAVRLEAVVGLRLMIR